jgi:hypothetical protein
MPWETVRLLKEPNLKAVGFIISVIFSFSAWATVPSQEKIMGFKVWHKQQVNAAQNRVVRLLNRITFIRTTTGNLGEINKLEGDLRGAVQYVEVVKDLSMEDYFNVYLSNQITSQAALIKVAKSMSKQEVAELLHVLLRSRSENLSMESLSPTAQGLTRGQVSPVRM